MNDRDPIDELAESFVERYRRGERPSLSEYTSRCPEQAQRIEKLFPTLVLMEEMASADASVPGTLTKEGLGLERLGEYRILREVGRGGMGVVYEAEQESLGRRVALKVLPSSGLMDSSYLKRFQREARAVASLHHNNIVPVFDVGEDEGIHYYAMQFIRGQGLDVVLAELVALRGDHRGKESSLSARVSDPADNSGRSTGNDANGDAHIEGDLRSEAVRGQRPAHSKVAALTGSSSLSNSSTSDQHFFRSVSSIGAQTADALACAHEQGILHRDVKPSNLMLDTDGKVWVTDFGLAKTDAKEDLTHTGDLIGTLRYMAPERFDGWSDPRSDIYGLGLTLYEMLTLRPAYAESDRAKLIRQITNEDFVHPRRLDPHIPIDLETIVLKCTAREPSERYQSAGQLADDLRRFIDDKPIEARRTSLGERTKMWCRRNPLVASLTTAVVVLLLAGIGAASWAAIHFERLANETQQVLNAKNELLKTKNELVDQLTEAKRIATDRLYRSGRFHYDRAEYDLAVEDFSALLEADPKNSKALWWRGEAYGSLERFGEAVADFSRYVELNPNSAGGYSRRGVWYGEGGEFRQAIADLKSALEFDPRNHWYQKYLAWYLAMGPVEDRDLDLAIRCAQQSVSKSRAGSHYTTLGIVHYRRGEYDQAIKALENAAKRQTGPDSHNFFLAMSHQQRGELDAAVRYYRLATDNWLEDEPRYRLRVQNIYAIESEDLISTHLEAHPEDYEWLFRRAELRRRLNKFEDAIRDTTRLVELRPNHYLAYFCRACNYMHLGKFQSAIVDLEKSVSLEKSDYWPCSHLAWCYLLVQGQTQDLDKAEEMANEAVHRGPNSEHPKKILGLIHYRRGRFADAIQVLANIPNGQKNDVVQRLLGMSYHHLGQVDEARAYFASADENWKRLGPAQPFTENIRRLLQTEAKQLIKSAD